MARPIATSKNKPCLDFLATTPLVSDGNGYVFRLADSLPPPEHVRIIGLEGAPPLRAVQLEN